VRLTPDPLYAAVAGGGAVRGCDVEMRIIYMSYTDMPGAAPYFRYLPDGKPTYDLVLEGAEIMELVATKIHTDSTRDDDPIIEIVVLTGTPISADDANRITQQAYDWLVDEGHIPIRRKGEE